MSLVGKVAVVTGAARGLGRAYALRLATLGADVAVLDIDLAAAAQFGERLAADTVTDEIIGMGRRSIGVQANLGIRDEATAALQNVQAAFGRIDILVNNAGGLIAPVERSGASVTPDEDIKLLFDANFYSMVYCCQAVIPGMRQRGGGVVVNITSQSGVTVYTGGQMAIYGTAKAAVTHYTRYLAAEVGPWGIRANCISPGIIMTSRVQAQAAQRGVGTNSQADALPLRRFGTPEDCAGVLEFLATDLSQYVTGQCICADGGAVLTPT